MAYGFVSPASARVGLGLLFGTNATPRSARKDLDLKKPSFLARYANCTAASDAVGLDWSRKICAASRTTDGKRVRPRDR